MDAVTPATLLARLRVVYGVTTDEDLAHALNTRLRSVARWKKNKGLNFWTTIDLLNRAGWLTPTDEVPSPDRLRAAERYAKETLAEAKRLAQQPPGSQPTDEA